MENVYLVTKAVKSALEVQLIVLFALKITNISEIVARCIAWKGNFQMPLTTASYVTQNAAYVLVAQATALNVTLVHIYREMTV